MNLADLFSNYHAVRAELVEVVKDLSQPHLDWATPDYLYSVGDIMLTPVQGLQVPNV